MRRQSCSTRPPDPKPEPAQHFLHRVFPFTQAPGDSSEAGRGLRLTRPQARRCSRVQCGVQKRQSHVDVACPSHCKLAAVLLEVPRREAGRRKQAGKRATKQGLYVPAQIGALTQTCGWGKLRTLGPPRGLQTTSERCVPWRILESARRRMGL